LVDKEDSMNAISKNSLDTKQNLEADEHLLYSLLLMGMPGHIDIKHIMVTDQVSSELVIVGPYGVWLAGTVYLGGVIFLENGVYIREKMDLMVDGIRTSRMDILEEVKERWLREKEAVKNVLSSSLPGLLKEFPRLIKGGVCLAQYDNGLNRTFPAAYGIDETREDENNALGRPKDKNGIPVEPILSEIQVQQIANALVENSLKIINTC